VRPTFPGSWGKPISRLPTSTGSKRRAVDSNHRHNRVPSV
jgi:hypothetical protein